MNWPDLLVMNWPAAKWVSDTDAAGDELRQFFGRNEPSNDEVCRVIRWMAGPEGKQERAPTLRELIRAICIRRKADRQSDAPPEEQNGECGLCGWSGMLGVWPTLPPSVKHLDTIPAQCFAVPCWCAKGHKALHSSRDYGHSHITERRTLARDQARSLNREADELADLIAASGKPASQWLRDALQGIWHTAERYEREF